MEIPHRLSIALSLLVFLALATGCAQVGLEHGQPRPADKSLVFGKILLVRDGERRPLSTFSTPVTLGRLTATGEPKLVTEPIDPDGRFRWLLAPGLYHLTIRPNRFETLAFGFRVPKIPGNYYFGDLLLTGEKRFYTIGGANIRNVRAVFEDHFEADRQALLTKEPQLAGSPTRRLTVVDMSRPAGRLAVFRELLDQAPLCCARLADLPYRPLALGESVDVQITPDSGTFDFSTGRSFFAALALPSTPQPYEIRLHSRIIPTGIAGRFRIFVPAALLLDSRFQVVGRIEDNLLTPVSASILPFREASMRGRIVIGGKWADARYLVLFTTDRLLSRGRSTTIPGMVPVPGGALPIAPASPATMTPWITGRIDVTLKAVRAESGSK